MTAALHRLSQMSDSAPATGQVGRIYRFQLEIVQIVSPQISDSFLPDVPVSWTFHRLNHLNTPTLVPENALQSHYTRF